MVLKISITQNKLQVLEIVESEPEGIFDEAAVKNLNAQKAAYLAKHSAGDVFEKKFEFSIEGECETKS